MEIIDFHRNYDFIKNYHHYHLEKRAHVASGTTFGRWNETLYLIEFYENDILVDTFIVNEKALAIANAKVFVSRKATYRMCSL